MQGRPSCGRKATRRLPVRVSDCDARLHLPHVSRNAKWTSRPSPIRCDHLALEQTSAQPDRAPLSTTCRMSGQCFSGNRKTGPSHLALPQQRTNYWQYADRRPATSRQQESKIETPYADRGLLAVPRPPSASHQQGGLGPRWFSCVWDWIAEVAHACHAATFAMTLVLRLLTL